MFLVKYHLFKWLKAYQTSEISVLLVVININKTSLFNYSTIITMKFHRSMSTVLASVSFLTLATTYSLPTQVAIARPRVVVVECSPIKGTWSYQGKNIGVYYHKPTNVIKVLMSNFRRPAAKGRMLSATQIEVNFPDDGTFIGTLDGQGKISWNNGTVWQATTFTGAWKYEDKYGPNIMKARANSEELKISMAKYGRPAAFGYPSLESPSQATFNFPDDATHTATLVSPHCMKWSNGTVWTK
jgi:hypothetical protein